MRTVFYLAAALAWLAAEAAKASPWARPDNEFLVISRADYFNADLGEISVDGRLVDGRFQRVESNTYIEFGLTDEITLGGKVLYGTSWLTRGPDAEISSGFSEIEFFAQHQVFQTGWHAGAVKITAGIPTNFDSGLRPDQQNEGAELDVSALYGRAIIFQPIKIFTTVELGYRKRFGASADQARLLTTVGIEPGERWLFLLDSFSVKSLENERANGVDYDVVKLQPSVVWRATSRLGVQVGMSEEIAGRNIALGRTFFIGVWTKF